MISFGSIFFLASIILLQIFFIVSCMRRSRKAERFSNEYRLIAEKGQETATHYLKACRLISIARSGRQNIWTFARGDQTFIIETMGTWADDLDKWKKQAGLD